MRPHHDTQITHTHLVENHLVNCLSVQQYARWKWKDIGTQRMQQRRVATASCKQDKHTQPHTPSLTHTHTHTHTQTHTHTHTGAGSRNGTALETLEWRDDFPPGSRSMLSLSSPSVPPNVHQGTNKPNGAMAPGRTQRMLRMRQPVWGSHRSWCLSLHTRQPCERRYVCTCA